MLLHNVNLIRNNVPFVTFYSSVFYCYSYFHLSLLYMRQCLVRVGTLSQLKHVFRKVHFCVSKLFSCMCVCGTWQTCCLGTVGDRDLLPLSEASKPLSLEGLK